MEQILLVDGYNIIGAGQGLGNMTEEDLSEARDWLADSLAEYQGYTGIHVYLIFDAHMVQGIGQMYEHKKIKVIYTKENETADERIERMVKELKRVRRTIYVASSDYTEQRLIFGQGALRKSARELMNELKNMNAHIKDHVQTNYHKKPKGSLPLKPEMAKLFEKLRRGE